MPLDPPPASRPGSPDDPPPPPRRSKQQCVAGLQVESHGAPAWISWSFSRTLRKSPAHEHAPAPPLPLVDPELLVVLPDDVLLVLPDEELELDELVDDVDDVEPLLGGGSTALLSSAGTVPSAMSGPCSAHAATARISELVRTRPAIPTARFMGVRINTIEPSLDNRRRLTRAF